MITLYGVGRILHPVIGETIELVRKIRLLKPKS